MNANDTDEDETVETHDGFCNCEDCWWARDCQEVCATCGCIVGAGCPESGHDE